jgi:1,4-alpha-glucan branching enzyme
VFPSNVNRAQRKNPSAEILHLAAIIAVTTALVTAMPAFAQSSRPGWGATPYSNGLGGNGCTFRVWAPNATSINVAGVFNNWSTTANPLVEEQTNSVLDGVWSADVSSVTNYSQYKYYIHYNGSGFYKHDPRARYVTAAGGGQNDIVYNPANFNWNGDNFTPPPLNNLVIYEMHMGTFPPGTSPSRFINATNELGYLANLGVNVVEIMPVAEFGNSGSSWGYDPAQPFAVDNSQYGGPDGLKTFIMACHQKGLAVLLDVVHNHYGPNELDMWNFDGWAGDNSLGGGGIYFYESNTNLQITPWANTRPNFSSNQVCSFIEDSISMWLNEYHVDGFRWDAPSAIINANDGSYITAAGNLLSSINAMIHTNYVNKISIAEDVYNYIGFDSAWDTSYPYSLTPILTNTIDGKRDMNTVEDDVLYNVRYGGNASVARVAFLESHDVVGDLNDGKRVVTAIDPVTPNSYRARKLSTLGAAIVLTEPGIPMIFQGQEMLENQSFDSGRNVDWTKTNTYSYIVKCYSDLIKARLNVNGGTPGLGGDQVAMQTVDNTQKIIAYDRWSSTNVSQKTMFIANFADTTNSNYSVRFPSAGTWYVYFNGDSTNYGPDYGNIGSTVVTAGVGLVNTGNVTIGPYSALILSQIPPTPPLSINQTNGGMTISWPASPTGWLLYTTPNLAGSPPPWTLVPTSQYQTNGTTIVYNPASPNGNVFYQLQKP